MTQRMKIIHILPTLIQGGVSRLIVDYLNMEETKGEDQHLLYKMFNEKDFFDSELTVPIHHLGAKRTNIIVYFVTLLRAFIRFNWVLFKERPDVVVGWHYYGGMFSACAKLFGCRVIWSIHATNMNQSSKKIIPRISQHIARILASISPDKIHFCSKEGLQSHCAYGWPQHKMVVIENGINTEVFHRKEITRAEIKGLSLEKTYLFCCVGRFDPEKDHKNLFSALRDFKDITPDFTCLVIGLGCDNENHTLASMVDDFGLKDQVILCGQRKDLPLIYSVCDYKILSSAMESMPLVVLEAISCGCPVIATDVGSTKLITNRFGIIVPAKNSQALTQALLSAYRDEALKADTYENGHAYIVEHYGLLKMCEQLTLLFKGKLPHTH